MSIIQMWSKQSLQNHVREFEFGLNEKYEHFIHLMELAKPFIKFLSVFLPTTFVVFDFCELNNFVYIRKQNNFWRGMPGSLFICSQTC